MTFPILATAPTGLTTLVVKVRQHSTGFFLDFADGLFKAVGHTTPSTPLSEPDATDFPGLYSLDLDPSTWVDDLYVGHVTDTAGVEEFSPGQFEVRNGRFVGVEVIAEVGGIVRWRNSTLKLEVLAFLLIDGNLHDAATSASVTIYESGGTVFVATLTDLAPDANGIFDVESAALASCPVETSFYAVVEITAPTMTVKGVLPFVFVDAVVSP